MCSARTTGAYQSTRARSSPGDRQAHPPIQTVVCKATLAVFVGRFCVVQNGLVSTSDGQTPHLSSHDTFISPCYCDALLFIVYNLFIRAPVLIWHAAACTGVSQLLCV